MQEALIHCHGYTSEALMTELAPFMDESVTLELRAQGPRMRSAGIDPSVLAAVIQAGATVLAALIVGCIEFRKRADARAPKPTGPILIRGGDGTVIEVPVDVDRETLTALVQSAQRIDRPRIYLG